MKGQWAHEEYRTMREEQRLSRVYRTKILLSKRWSVSKIATSLGVGINTVRTYVKECKHIKLSKAKTYFTVICPKCSYRNYMFYGRYDKCKKCGAKLFGGCFIATAVYGTPLADEINVLRNWRDVSLMNNFFGRIFVKIYYTISPPIANFISKSEKLKKIVRAILKPFIIQLKKKN